MLRHAEPSSTGPTPIEPDIVGEAVLLRTFTDKAWGLANRDERKANTPETQFRIGSWVA